MASMNCKCEVRELHTAPFDAKLLTNWPSFHYSVQKLHETKFKFFPEADVEAQEKEHLLLESFKGSFPVLGIES